jgi:uncharacterized cupin superfamily protein
MPTPTGKSPLVTAVDRAKNKPGDFFHPLDPQHSKMRGFSLSEEAGLERTGVHLVTLLPGMQSFVYHTHTVEEEWMFVLQGRGRIEIDGVMHEIGTGDFVGFATPSAAHQLHNPYSEDLTYLSGGERRQMEIAEFPRLGKVMVRVGPKATLYAKEGSEPMSAEVEVE